MFSQFFIERPIFANVIAIITILLGIAGAFVGTWIGRLIWGPNYLAGWILSILGAMLLLLIYRMIASKRT